LEIYFEKSYRRENMKKLLLIFLFLFGCLGFSGFTQTDEKQYEKTNCEFIAKSLDKIHTIKVGMRRRELLTVFETEGGISTRTQRQYVYKKCGYIKVKIKFEPDTKEDKFAESPNDKIIEISEPYLQYAITD
jgi:hypothetical protein